MRKRHLVLAAATISVGMLGVQYARAASYASQVSISGSTISFDLNEGVTSGATPGNSTGDVKLVLDNGAGVVDLGLRRMQSVTLNSSQTSDLNPSAVQVAVTTNDGAGYLAANNNTATPLNVDPNDNSTQGTLLFGSLRGMAVDTNPADANFGLIYAGNTATHGAGTDGAGAAITFPQLGIYILNPDFTFKGANATEEAAATSGTALTTFNAGIGFSGSSSIYRLEVGGDGYLYVTDWTSAQSSIYRAAMSPVTNTGGTIGGGLTNGVNVLTTGGNGTANSVTNADGNAESIQTPATGGNHTDPFSKAFVSGSGANTTLYAVDMDYGSSVGYGGDNGPYTSGGLDENQLYAWNIGTSVPTSLSGTQTAINTSGYTGQPTRLTAPETTSSTLALDTRFWNQPLPSSTQDWWYSDYYDVTYDLTRGGPASQFYFVQSRNAGESPSLFVMSAEDNATVIWDSLDEVQRQQDFNAEGITADILYGLRTVDASPDGRFLVVGQAYGSTIKAQEGSYMLPLLAGIPDMKLLQAIPYAPVNTVYTDAFDPADNFETFYGADLQSLGGGGQSVTVTGSNGTFYNGSGWNTGVNGNLSDTTKWAGQVLPNGSNQAITFGAFTSSAVTVNVDMAETVGAITFSQPTGMTGTNGYTLAGGAGGSITLSGLGVNLTANAGNNTITAPVTVESDFGLYAAAGASLTVSGTVTYSTVSGSVVNFAEALPNVVKNGQGKVSISNLNLVQSDLGDPSSGNLDIYDGTLQLLPNSGPAVVSELTILNSVTGHTNPSNASLDLTNNDLIYDYNLDSYTTTSPESVVQGLVASGGIFTSTGGVSKGIGLAVVENNGSYLVTPFSTFDGQTITTTSSTGGTVLVKYTYFGDLNLDGVVDGTDFALMGGSKLGWAGGDLNYDGKFNSDDWSLYFLGQAAYNETGVALGQVPEPGSLGLIALAAIPSLRRRRK